MGALTSLERELAGITSLSDLAGPILWGIQRLVGATGSTLFSFQQQGMVSTQGGSLEQAMRSYTPDLFAEDALQQWAQRLPGSSFLSDGVDASGAKPDTATALREFDLAAYTRSRPYVDFYRPHDIGFVLAIWPTGLKYGTPNMFGVLLTTPPPFEPFGSAVLAKLRHLEVPMRIAAQRIARFSALEQKGEVLGQLLGRKHGAFVLWDPEGRLAWASADARLQLGGDLRKGDFVAATHVALRQLRKDDPATRETVLGRPYQFRSASGTLLRVVFSWLPGSDRRPWLLAELNECVGPRQRLSELTRAETRILMLLVQGLTNAEMSERLRVSPETVKTHVRRILQKLDTNSRAKAVAIAHEALRELG